MRTVAWRHTGLSSHDAPGRTSSPHNRAVRIVRQVYRLLGLVKKWGAGRVDTACAKALDAETVNVGLIERMLERAAEGTETPLPVQGKLLPGRFARDPGEFAVGGGDA
jgi:hypothetical protein